MQKPYTKKAEKVLEIAKKASRSMHHSYIGTEHLLIGLLGEGSGAAAKVLSSVGVDEERILELIENLIAPSGNVITADAGGAGSTRSIISNRRRFPNSSSYR